MPKLSGKPESVPVQLDDLIEKDEVTVRAYINPDTVERYQVIYGESELEDPASAMPPITVFEIDDEMVLTKGFHRVAAARQLGWQLLPALVKTGSVHDAWREAVEDNMRHGWPFSLGDKRRIVEQALNDPEYKLESSRWLAGKLGVSHTYVDQMRREHQAEVELNDISSPELSDTETLAALAGDRAPTSLTCA